MRVLMLGWEFPPFISGGLGTACYGLTKAMSSIGLDVMFVLPRPVSTPFSTHVKLVSPRGDSPLAGPSSELRLDEFEHVTFRTVNARIGSPYQTPEQYATQVVEERTKVQKTVHVAKPAQPQPVPEPATPPQPQAVSAAGPQSAGSSSAYGGDLFSEIHRYATLAAEIARNEDFDVVHAHDWMTFPAGLAVAGLKGKPLIVHVHSTEFDRSGDNIDQRIYDIDRRGMHVAMKVVAVSHLTKNICVHRYGLSPDKVEVIYNAIDLNGNHFDPNQYRIQKDEKIVLFLGRITQQKGPEYFLSAAKKVLEVMDNVKFVMAGSGDMIRRVVEMAVAMGIGHKVLFTGFLRGADVEKVFKLADLYVMPSVSEPFGIAPLEAMSHDVPVLISKQSGVSEVLKHALKVDFWDIDEMANKIVAVLRHPPLARTLREHAAFEVRRRTWVDAARECRQVYETAIDLMSSVPMH
ncbi:MAG: glycosyltransferase [Tepidisphaeraceae bacterium]|jgi:glycosyltransferase involved in cell wall biosynthesis